MSLTRKRKKELRKLQEQANHLWATQQSIVGDAGQVAREAGRQLSYLGREQVLPQVQEKYQKYAQPYIDKGVQASRHVLNDRVVPAAGAVVGSAMSVLDAAGETRARLAAGRGLALDKKKYAKKSAKYGKRATRALARQLSVQPERNRGIGAGGVIAIVLGVIAAAGVAYAAWQTLRADDELWVADDSVRGPEA